LLGRGAHTFARSRHRRLRAPELPREHSLGTAGRRCHHSAVEMPLSPQLSYLPPKPSQRPVQRQRRWQSATSTSSSARLEDTCTTHPLLHDGHKHPSTSAAEPRLPSQSR
jgi:hypothetical protein